MNAPTQPLDAMTAARWPADDEVLVDSRATGNAPGIIAVEVKT